jgi:hypothetical protein
MAILFRSVKELKEQTPKILKAAQEADIIITLRGKPQILVRRFTEEDLSEALARSEQVKHGLARGIADLKAGRTKPVRLRRAKASARAV